MPKSTDDFLPSWECRHADTPRAPSLLPSSSITIIRPKAAYLIGLFTSLHELARSFPYGHRTVHTVPYTWLWKHTNRQTHSHTYTHKYTYTVPHTQSHIHTHIHSTTRTRALAHRHTVQLVLSLSTPHTTYTLHNIARIKQSHTAFHTPHHASTAITPHVSCITRITSYKEEAVTNTTGSLGQAASAKKPALCIS